jgi:hypothetical protein
MQPTQRDMTISLRERGVREKCDPSHPGTRTGRRDGVGPAGGLLGGKDPAGHYIDRQSGTVGA